MKRMLLGVLAVAAVTAVVLWFSQRRRPAPAGLPAPAAPQPAPVAPPARPASPAPPAPADDLTSIKGIGPVYAARLADLGITTFSALAAADPHDLATRLDATAAADVASWIEQARRLGSS